MATPSLIAETMNSPFFCLFNRDAIVLIISERIRLFGQNTVVFSGMFSNVAVTSIVLTMFICSIKCFMASILFHRPYGDGVRLPINQCLVVTNVLWHTATLDVADQRTGRMALRRSFEGENPRTSRTDVQYVFHRNFHFLLSFLL